MTTSSSGSGDGPPPRRVWPEGASEQAGIDAQHIGSQPCDQGRATAEEQEWTGKSRHPAPPVPSLPVIPTRYHGFWRAPRWSFWKPLVALAVGIVGYLAVSTGLSILALYIDASTGRVPMAEHVEQLQNGGGLTPSLFILNNLSLAACILLAWAGGAINAQRPGWLSSVVGHFRWRWFLACLGWLLPLWIIMMVVTSLVPATAGEGTALHVSRDTGIMIAGVLVTTPLQCAGEEFGFRGLVNRAVASFVPQNTRIRALISALMGGVGSSLLFMLAHSAQDPWLNLFYFCFGAGACYLCHVSGGLEASMAMHIVNNMTSMVFLPFMDFSRLFDRAEGSGNAWGLIQLAAVAGGAAIITWRVKRRGIVSEGAPAGLDLDAPGGTAMAAPGASTPGAPGHGMGQASSSLPVVPASYPEQAYPGRQFDAPVTSGTSSGPGIPWQPTAPPIGDPWDENGRPLFGDGSLSQAREHNRNAPHEE